jgi:hypothetical protein
MFNQPVLPSGDVFITLALSSPEGVPPLAWQDALARYRYLLPNLSRYPKGIRTMVSVLPACLDRRRGS